MNTLDNILDLQSIAASQWGLFTTAQAQHAGVGRNQIGRMAADGRIDQMTYGVYRFVAGDESKSADVKAAWLSIHPKENAWERLKARPFDAVVAGRTAASQYEAGDFYPTPFTFIVNERKQTTRNDIKYLLWTIDEEDIEYLNGLPTTSAERTVADLIRLNEDRSLVDDFMSDLYRRDIAFDPERLARLLNPLAARNGYDRHDGEAFAKDLIERNALQIQVDKAAFAVLKALEPFRDQRGKLDEILAASPALRDVQDILARAHL